MKKLNLGILFGGRSCEHEVSVTSARSILEAVDRERYNVSLIGIDKAGHWRLGESIEALTADGAVRALAAPDAGSARTDEQVTVDLHHDGNLTPTAGTSGSAPIPALDVVFPVLHGTFGEDGTLQGVLEMAGIPYVGCGVAASALAMDKILAKKVFQAAGLPQADYLAVTYPQWRQDPAAVTDSSESHLGYPVFVKPANLGSSVGVGKASDPATLVTAIEEAFRFDRKIVIERSMENCREIECAVLGNHDPSASVLGEIIPGAEFYDYTTKYIDDKTELVVPANLDAETTARVQQHAIEAFLAIDGAGLARVDFFVDRDTGEIVLNEVNTLPGFTPISMYPRLWAASGVSYDELINRLIELAFDAHGEKARLQRAISLPGA